jgi:hypothetical protein
VTTGGPLFAGFHPVVPDNGYYNFLAAFRKRCNYFCAERASPQIISRSTELISLLAPQPLPSFEWTSELFEAWLVKFGPEKQARMRAAVELFPTATLKDYSSKEIFVKTEALLVQHKPNWAPRVIYKGTDIYNALSGPLFCELMSRLDACFNRMDGKYRFKAAYKKTPEVYTPFVSGGSGEFIECDFSANDMKQCSDVMLLEIMLMRRLGCPEWFIRLHSKTNHFVVSNKKHGVRAELDNQLPTGATDTTFRNTFWNACILFAFLNAQRATRCNALLLGDDMLARIEGLGRYAAKTYQGIASEAKMDAKVKRFRGLVNCSFLSKLFIPRPSQPVTHLTVPLLGKALARFNMRANLNAGVSDPAYFMGKALGYAYEFRFVPCLRDIFLERFSIQLERFSEDRKMLKAAGVEVSWNAREAGVTLSNIRDKLIVEDVVGDDDFNVFIFHRYGVFGYQVVALFEEVILGSGDAVEGDLVQLLAADFVA